jgi:enoyl-CoA hydratase
MTEELLFEKRGEIGWVTFNRPKARNALTFAMYEGLAEICARVGKTGEVRVLVVTGGGDKAFAAGTDIAQFQSFENGEDGIAYEQKMDRILGEIERCSVPTIAAINGFCGGGGCELALACDIRLAGPGDYTIGQMEILVGILPGAGGTTRLARLVGPGKALEWVLRGRTFSPKEAAAEGLVHHYIDGDVLAAAHDMAREFLDKPAAALAAIKQVIRSSWGKTTADGVDEEGDLFAHVIGGSDRALEMMKEYVAGGHKLKKF